VYVVEAAKGVDDDTITLSTTAESELGYPITVTETQIKLKVLATLPEGYWWPIFSGNIGIIAKAVDISKPLVEYANVIGAATVSESYELAQLLTPLNEAPCDDEHFVFINTGTIDRYESLWATNPTQYIKTTYQSPVLSQKILLDKMPTRYGQARAHKLILAGMVKALEGVSDAEGVMLAGKSTVLVMDGSLSLQYILSLVNSKLLTFLSREIFGSLALSGGFLSIGPPQVEKLPIRRINFTTVEKERKQLLKQGKGVVSGIPPEPGLG